MSRHSKNNTASSVFTQHERRLLKYGTYSERIGTDSIKTFDACSLCIHSVIEPMCCKEGHLFCKECVYGYLLAQKKEITRQTELWKKQETRLKDEGERKQIEAKLKEIEEFDEVAHGLTSQTVGSSAKSREKPEEESEREAKKAKLTSFWVPGVREEAEPSLIEKPNSDPVCPEGPHPLRLKQLVKLNFTPNPETEGKEHAKGKFQCPSCCKTLSNSTKAVTLTSCGHVLCQVCFDTTKSDGHCFVCAKKFKEKHVLKIQSGGTGFSETSGEKLKPKIFSPTAWI